MKKALIYFCAMATLSACTPSAKTEKAEPAEKNASAITYTCPMHPKVAETKPGACPKCGMDLVEKTNEN
jgi:hypothetical protein